MCEVCASPAATDGQGYRTDREVSWPGPPICRSTREPAPFWSRRRAAAAGAAEKNTCNVNI